MINFQFEMFPLLITREKLFFMLKLIRYSDILILLFCFVCSLSRHTSAFKPVHPNILNIRAKGPHTPSPAHHAHEATSSAVAVGGGDGGQGPPPLLPRVAKLGGQGKNWCTESQNRGIRLILHFQIYFKVFSNPYKKICNSRKKCTRRLFKPI